MADEQVGEVQFSMDSKNSKMAGDFKKNNRVCFFYSRNKRCKFGDKCGFVHSDVKHKILEVTSVESPAVDIGNSGSELLNKNEELPTSESSDKVALRQQSTEYIKEGTNKMACTNDMESIQKTSSLEPGFQNDQMTTTEKLDSEDAQDVKSTSKKRCRFFFTKSGCVRGDGCHFSHTTLKNDREHKKKSDHQTVQTIEIKNDEKESKGATDKPKPRIRQSNRVVIKNVQTSTRLSMLDENEVKKLRARELTQIERGFGKLGLKILQENNETACCIKFSPSDPDWPFDIETVVLIITFPADYPITMFRASLSEQQNLPVELIRLTNEGISKWLDQQQKVRSTRDTMDLPFRPFLRWLDRNIEELFIQAAKKMRKDEEDLDLNESQNEERNYRTEGTESRSDGDLENVIPNKSEHQNNRIEKKPQQRQIRKNNYEYSSSISERKELLLSDFLTFKKPIKIKGDKGAVTSKNNHGNSAQTEETKKSHIILVDEDLSMRTHDNLIIGKTKKDEVDDNLNLDFQKDEVINAVLMKEGEDVSTNPHKGTELRFKGLELSENTSTLTTDSVALTMECLKCKSKMDTKIEKSRTSSIRCDKCSRVLRISYRPSVIHQFSSTLGYLDLEGWHPLDLVMTEIQLTAGCLSCSHVTNIKGPHYGSNQAWCSKCHQKLSFSLETTRFFELTPTAVHDENDAALGKPKKKPRGPGLREGFPLPDNGTCKHYKKSFRWLRFPCCGKCYPCDVCHEEREDHEMKYANRMVCGFCSKEQPYSQNACVACSSFTTKVKTSHWEGGKGCRNKIFMSKGDDKKFKNTMKTISRKAQAKETPKVKAH